MDGDVDTLLERYLALLDEYSQLRTSLSSIQAGMYQDIARANFSAERGIRYGQDFYDDRMQALRRVSIADSAAGACFRVVPKREEDALDKEVKLAGRQEESLEMTRQIGDPLRWFGLLTPMPLRNAQGRATQVVEHIIPKLATVAAEMAEVEIRVRRARKKRSRAAAAEK